METEATYIVQPSDADAGVTLLADRWWISVAARAFPALATTSKAKRERKAGRLRLNGDAGAATNTPVAVGDRITYTALAAPRSASNDANEHVSSTRQRSTQEWLTVCARQGMRLVYENDAFAVIVKPVGVHVKGRGLRTVEYALPALLHSPSAHVRDALPRPHALHRLDYRVGGLLMVAKTRSAEVLLSAQFERHSVVKKYRAILVGRVDPSNMPGVARVPPPDLGDVNARLSRSQGESRPSDNAIYFYDAPLQDKRCCTALQVVSVSPSARYGWITTVNLWPLTGRWHQLRLHTASLGHPIVGDDLHHGVQHEQGSTTKNTDDSKVVRGLGLFLHAIGISFADDRGNCRAFEITEPHKYGRFRHFCALNRRKQLNHELRRGSGDT